MARDLFSALVDGVAATDEQVDASAARAAAMDVAPILDAWANGNEAVDELVRLALVAVVTGIEDQLSIVVDMVASEGAALKLEDARKVKAITSFDVAARRQERAGVGDERKP